MVEMWWNPPLGIAAGRLVANEAARLAIFLSTGTQTMQTPRTEVRIRGTEEERRQCAGYQARIRDEGKTFPYCRSACFQPLLQTLTSRIPSAKHAKDLFFTSAAWI